MKSNEGKLQTAEHVLSHLLEHSTPPAKVVIAKFKENLGQLEVMSKEDLRLIDLTTLQAEINKIINRRLPVKIYFLQRAEAEKKFDLSRLPVFVTAVRVVDIEGFDATPCKDPHVTNTSEIGSFTFMSVKRAGKDRYRFSFRVG